ncbi:hypothetical protein VW35_08495 [Devosia soli]|uniref:Uncharacterized protein n=1 Tax=Devosia soli TaxID=361041 RepID=A0A0F5LDG2_9HYPH|nr:hypothetical protein VW35_08495 [Devosia soli]
MIPIELLYVFKAAGLSNENRRCWSTDQLLGAARNGATVGVDPIRACYAQGVHINHDFGV